MPRANGIQERSLPDPMLSGGYNAAGNPLPGAGLGTDPNANIGVMVSQELPYPGNRDARSAVASREADAEFQQIEAARLSVAARVKQAYYALAYTQATGAVLERNRELLATLLKVSEQRYAVGLAQQQDVIKAQTQLSVLELQQQRIQQLRRARQGDLNALLARPAGTPIGETEDLRFVPFAEPLDHLVAQSVANAPMLKREQLMSTTRPPLRRPTWASRWARAQTWRWRVPVSRSSRATSAASCGRAASVEQP